MDDPNITIEEYIKLEEEKARRRCKVYNWETAKYGKIWYDEDVHDLRFVETEFPAIVFNDELSSEKTLSCEPTVSSLNNNKIDFRILFDESDDEDYTVIFDKNSFSYKIISVNDLKMDSENDNEKVNMPSFPSPEPMVKYLTEPTLCPQHIDEFDLKDETSLSEYDEVEQNVLYFIDLFPFNIIYPDDLKSVIMEYLVKISKKARILKLKQRHLKIIVLTSNTPYLSRKIRCICACTSQKTTKETRSISRIQGRPIRRIQAMEIKYSRRYQMWSLLQETPDTPY
ncbi:hypothetical protein Tco_0723505 [Tanacetum coccineum]